MYKLGKLPHKKDARDLKWKSFRIESQLPKPPPSFGNELLHSVWDSLGNNEAGNCVAEGTEVSGPDVEGAFRIPYRGPLLTIRLASGKRLTVTPKHGLLTPGGFASADSLKQGDYLVGTSRSQELPVKTGPGQFDFNKFPTPVEKVFTSLIVGGNSSRKVMPESVNFHGDESFFDGNIEIIRSDGLLGSQRYASLRQPKRQNQISPTRELKRVLVGAGAAFQTSLRSGAAPQSSVCWGSNGPTFSQAHSGVSETEALRMGSEGMARSDDCFLEEPAWQASVPANRLEGFSSGVTFNGAPYTAMSFGSVDPTDFSVSPVRPKASISHPSRDGGVTDPHFFGDLRDAFPGLVELDRVIGVDVQRNVRTHVYDLSTASRWYVANGIITHNCVFAGAAHEHMVWCGIAGKMISFKTEDVLRAYSAVTGYNPADPSTDNGTYVRDALKYRKEVGIPDSEGVNHKIGAYVWLDPGDVQDIYEALYVFECIGIGIMFPKSAWYQFENGLPWTLEKGSPDEGGHYIPLVAKRNRRLRCVTWGKLQSMTIPFYREKCDEAVVILSEDMLLNGISQEGFDMKRLLAAMNNIGTTVPQ